MLKYEGLQHSSERTPYRNNAWVSYS